MHLAYQSPAADPNHATFQLLLHTLRAQRGAGEGSTFIIGAGCSLSSSLTDISTAGIIRSIVEEIQSKPLSPNVSNVEVYRLFVNSWARLGDKQVTQLLARRLSGLTPGAGYQHLRNLAAKGFIRHIVTTNFDLLIDEAFTGLPYEVLFGNGEREHRGASEPVLTLIKVHGDVARDRPRFTPFEIASLPDHILTAVRAASQAPTIVCGYRGQDIGLMKALDNTHGFNAFWINPDLPDWADSYTYSFVHDWLQSRHSEVNCLYGSQYGRFDQVISLIDRTLENVAADHIDEPHSTAAMPAPWTETVFSKILTSNARLTAIFGRILAAVAKMAETGWRPLPPYYPESYSLQIAALLQPFKGDFIPSLLLAPVDNEFDGLLIGTAVAIRALSAGIDRPIGKLLADIAEDLARSRAHDRPDDNFWSYLSALLIAPLDAIPTEVGLTLNGHNRLKLVASPPNAQQVTELLGYLDALAFLFPTAKPIDNPPKSLRVRLAAQEHFDRVDNFADRTAILFRAMPQGDFDALCDLLLSSHIPSPARTDVSGHFVAKWFDIHAPITASETKETMTIGHDLFSTLLSVSDASMHQFSKLRSAFDSLSRTALYLQAEKEIARFLDSQTAGFFLIGPSGSGKTTALRNCFTSARHRSLLPILVSQAHRNRKVAGLQLFVPKLVTSDYPDSASEIEIMADVLAIRGCTLVLILDGLNEHVSSAEILAEDYRAILALGDAIAARGKNRIKLIVTCREATFLNLLRSDSMPDVRSFYWREDDKTLPQPYFAIPVLSLDESRQLIQLYFDPTVAEPFHNLLSTNRFLARDFSRPYIIAVAGATLSTVRELDGLKSVNHIFSRFTGEMLARLGDEAHRVTCYALMHAFFRLYLSNDSGPLPVPRIQLLSCLPLNERPLASIVLNALEDLNLIRHHAVATSGYIEFSHDRIAEFFLGEFLLAETQNAVLFQRAVRWAATQPICGGGLTQYLSRVWAAVEETDVPPISLLQMTVSNIVSNMHQGAEQLAVSLVRSLISCRDSAKITQSLLRAARRVVSREEQEPSSPTALFRYIIKGAEELARSDWAYEMVAFSALLEALWLDLHFSDSLKAEIFLVQSISLARSGNLAAGLARISEAIKSVGSREDTYLRDRIMAYKAVVIRESGNKRASQNLLRKIFNNQARLEAWDAAAVTALELGMALRDNTRFKEALRLYALVSEHTGELPTALRARLSVQIGVIYKNLAQRALTEGRANTTFGAAPGTSKSSRSRLRQTPMELLEVALSRNMNGLDWAESENSLELLIEALTERSECLLIAARLDSSYLPQAELFLDRLEGLLRHFPMAARLVDLEKHRGIALALRGDFIGAMEHIERGRLLAIDHGLLFKACDCDYQIGLQVLLTLRYIPRRAYLGEGLAALDRAIAYYRENVAPTSEYLKNVLTWKKALRNDAKALGLE